MAGLILWEANVRYGRESAAASVLEVVVEEADDGWFVLVGDEGTADPPTAPATLWEEVCLEICCRFSCRAFASAFSCVRTKWARFCRNLSVPMLDRKIEAA